MKKSLIISFFFINSLLAGEPDHFTNRDHKLADSREFVNELANKYLEKGVSIVNASNSNCNEQLLYKTLRRYFGNHFFGKFTVEVIKSKNVERRDPRIYDSVFRDWKFYDGTAMASPIVKQLNMGMSAVMNIGGVELGDDKIEHLFGQGYYYFTLKNKNKLSMYDVMMKGTYRETFNMGGSRWQTGIKSYGDLAANFNGLRFWNHLLQKEDDVLGKEYNAGPFVVCENDKFVLTENKIDFANYFDDLVDESINCSTFATDKITKNFKKRVEDLGLTCPIDITRRDRLSSKYGKYFKWITNLNGNETNDFQINFKEL